VNHSKKVIPTRYSEFTLNTATNPNSTASNTRSLGPTADRYFAATPPLRLVCSPMMLRYLSINRYPSFKHKPFE
jgi:hypothetical protein